MIGSVGRSFDKFPMMQFADLRKFYAAALCTICVSASAGASATEDKPGVWLAFSIMDAFRSGDEDSRWHYWFDAQARFFDPGSGVTQWVARPGIGYRIGDNMKAWIGYGRFNTRNSSGTVADENRYWQQLDWRAGIWLGGNVTMRARLEERSVTTGEDTALVLRFLTKYVRPVGNNGNKNFVVGIEPFVELNDTDWTGDAGLSQNRTFIGMGFRLSDSVSVETGYMNQYIWVDGREDRSFHHATVSLNVRM